MLVALVSFVLCPAIIAAAQERQVAPELLSFDVIGRVHIKPPAPPPDSFGVDAARIASLPPLPNSRAVYSAFEAIHALGMNPLTAFAVAPATVAAETALKANQAQLSEVSQEHLNAGLMMHEWFHRDWTRTEVPALQSASITRPDLGVAYLLDLSKHTYREKRIASASSSSEDTYTVSAADDVMITFEKPPVHNPLGVMRLSGFAARGYRTEATFSLSSLLGWCSAGKHVLNEVEYVTDLPDPQVFSGPALEGSKLVREACIPTSAGSHREPGRLVVFRSTAFTGGAAGQDFVSVLERGNLRADERIDASLFAVPTNFTKAE
jgi:hypothetical protein